MVLLSKSNYLQAEVLSIIFQFDNFSSSKGKTNDKLLRRNACSISLVCSKWAPFGRSLLWHHVSIESSHFLDRQLPSFHPLKFLLKFPHLARFVRKISFYLSDGLELELPFEYNVESVFEELSRVGWSFLGRLLRSCILLEELDVAGVHSFFLLFALEQIPGTLKKVGWWERIDNKSTSKSVAHLGDLTSRISQHRQIRDLEIYSNSGFGGEYQAILHTFPATSLSLAGYTTPVNNNNWISVLRSANGIALKKLCIDYQPSLCHFLYDYPFLNLTSLLLRLTNEDQYPQFLDDVSRLLPLHSTLLVLTLTGPNVYPNPQLMESVLGALPNSLKVLTITFLNYRESGEMFRKFLNRRRSSTLEGIYVQGESIESWFNLVGIEYAAGMSLAYC